LNTILVVDDSSFQRRILTRLLSDAGYTIETAENGIKAIEALNDFHVDCMIMDIIMPEMGGIELLEHLKQNGYSVPVVVSTADIQRTTIEACLNLGAYAVVSKPVDRDSLLAILDEVLQ
jgi:CheY-like chemotaxis protein